jgi:hypothetical protein
MCTSIVEIVRAEGAAKSADGWFPLSHAVVCYDHPHYAQLEDAILIDFTNRARDPGTRAAVELTLESAKALREALDKAIAAAEFEEQEYRTGRPNLVQVKEPVRVLVEAG